MQHHGRVACFSRGTTQAVVRAVVIVCLGTAPLVGITACRAFADYGYATPDQSAPSDGRGDSARDQALAPDAFVHDASGDVHDASGDASDLVPTTDSHALPDAPLNPCANVPASVIARYAFDKVDFTLSPPTAQAVPPTAPSGTLVGSDIKSIRGPQGCGNALDFVPTSSSKFGHVEIPSSSAVENLTEGSIELWVHFDSPPSFQGILSRDAINQVQGGHITLFRLSNGTLAARLQAKKISTIEEESIACAPAPSLHTWHHIVITFGRKTDSPPRDDLEIYVDGAKGADTTSKERNWLDCHKGVNHTTTGISGNENPWVLGASAYFSSEGFADDLELPFVGAIDDFRIHNTRISP